MTQEQYWREQEARVREMVTLALAVAQEAALQQMERQLAQQLLQVQAGDEREVVFEGKAAMATVRACFARIEEKLEDVVGEVLEEMELAREWDGE